MADAPLYLLDTNVMSDMMRNPLGNTVQRFRKVLADHDAATVCTSVVVECELLFGLRRRTHPRWQTHYELLMDSARLKLENWLET